MKAQSKRKKLIESQIKKENVYSLEDAVSLLKTVHHTKFDETVEVAFRLGIDPKKSEQMVRGTCALPHGLGKVVRVLVFVKSKDKENEARAAGADYVGGDDLVEKIKEGWFDFDRVIATPDMMSTVGKIGKLLGPRGLMPNPRVGTVTNDIGKTVDAVKSGQVEFKVDKQGNLHVPVGKVSFTPDKLVDNVRSVTETVRRLKPPTAKGIYMRGISLSSTMGPGLKVQPN